jgi:hypothetical protein
MLVRKWEGYLDFIHEKEDTPHPPAITKRFEIRYNTGL